VSENGRLRHAKETRGWGARRRRVLELPTLRKLLRQLPSLNFGPANHDRQPRHGTLDPDE